jgi:serine/threonine protein kinase
VFLAVRRRDGAPFAVKVIEKRTLAGDPKQRQAVLAQLRKEVTILKLLDHPNIIHYYVSAYGAAFHWGGEGGGSCVYRTPPYPTL